MNLSVLPHFGFPPLPPKTNVSTLLIPRFSAAGQPSIEISFPYPTGASFSIPLQHGETLTIMVVERGTLSATEFRKWVETDLLKSLMASQTTFRDLPSNRIKQFSLSSENTKITEAKVMWDSPVVGRSTLVLKPKKGGIWGLGAEASQDFVRRVIQTIQASLALDDRIAGKESPFDKAHLRFSSNTKTPDLGNREQIKAEWQEGLLRIRVNLVRGAFEDADHRMFYERMEALLKALSSRSISPKALTIIDYDETYRDPLQVTHQGTKKVYPVATHKYKTDMVGTLLQVIDREVLPDLVQGS